MKHETYLPQNLKPISLKIREVPFQILGKSESICLKIWDIYGQILGKSICLKIQDLGSSNRGEVV